MSFFLAIEDKNECMKQIHEEIFLRSNCYRKNNIGNVFLRDFKLLVENSDACAILVTVDNDGNKCSTSLCLFLNHHFLYNRQWYLGRTVSLLYWFAYTILCSNTRKRPREFYLGNECSQTLLDSLNLCNGLFFVFVSSVIFSCECYSNPYILAMRLSELCSSQL